MGVPIPEFESAIEDATALALLDSLKTISAGERRKHASVFNYWLSIRRDRDFPPIRDLDPLEISDAGPFSILLEMVGGGEDAEIRHLGQAIKAGIDAEKVSEAPNPSLLSCVASRLPVVAACREAFAFEDEFEGPNGRTRCWVTLLPFSATGTWIDYVYGFVSLDPSPHAVDDAPEADEERVDADPEPAHPPIPECIRPAKQAPSEPFGVPLGPLDEDDESASEPVQEVAQEPEAEPETEIVVEPQSEVESEIVAQAEPEPQPRGKPGFSSKFFESLASVGGFYGKNVAVEPNLSPIPEIEEESIPVDEEEAEPIEQNPFPAVDEEPATVIEEEEPVAEEAPIAAEEPADLELETLAEEPADLDLETLAEDPAEPISPPSSTSEGTLKSKLTDVRSKADEARQAKLRANVALYEGLSAAYDFALDAEDAPEEYLKLVEEQGLKIQLRSPMKPVVKLAFDGMCDDATIKQLEAILAWAFDQELPRGTLAERIESEGGIGPILGRAA